MAPIAWFFIPDRPDKARFLTAEQRQIAEARAIRQTGKANRVGGVDIKQVLKAMLDLKMWFTAVSLVVSQSLLSLSLSFDIHITHTRKIKEKKERKK